MQTKNVNIFSVILALTAIYLSLPTFFFLMKFHLNILLFSATSPHSFLLAVMRSYTEIKTFTVWLSKGVKKQPVQKPAHKQTSSSQQNWKICTNLTPLQPSLHSFTDFKTSLKDLIFVLQCSVPKLMERPVQGCQMKAYSVSSKWTEGSFWTLLSCSYTILCFDSGMCFTIQNIFSERKAHLGTVSIKKKTR